MMFKILPQEQTFGLAVFCLVFYFFIYFLLRPAKLYPYSIPKLRYAFTIILLLVLSLFYFTVSDWFGYFKEFNEATRGANTHMETIYEWLAFNVTQNYIVWRLLVWGTALALLLLTIKRLPVPPALCLLVFVAMMFSRFAYTRTALAYSFMFFGCVLLYDQGGGRKALRYILAFAFIGCSYFFHKSALFGIAMILMALLVKKIDWKIMVLFLLIAPLLLYLLRNQISNFMMMEFETGEGDFGEYMTIGQTYMDHKRSGIRGISGIIHDILLRGPIIAMGVVCLLQGNNDSIPRVIRLFMRVTVFMVIASLICRLDLGANTYVMYYRFLNYAGLPAVFSLSYMYCNKIYPRLLKVIFFVAALGTFYELTYSAYVRYVNGAVSFGII